MDNLQQYVTNAVELLEQLISTPSVSREEAGAANIMFAQLQSYGFDPRRKGNNVWALSPAFEEGRPTLLLNAHVDTVKPVATWSRNPFTPCLKDGKLYGLGSNDCGGGLVALLQVFRILSKEQRPYNLVYLASCEEEISGAYGISSVIPLLPHIDVALVGEPTGMQPAVAERGLMVVDLIAHGKSGHAARDEGENAIYKALDDMLWIRDYKFKKVSPLLGATKMTLTVVKAGTQHNVVPDLLQGLIDIRTNELYTNEEVFDLLQQHIRSELRAHSFRLHSSSLPLGHPLVRRCIAEGMTPFGSPTLSDQALMPWPSLKLGPGESARSHSADEYIAINEIAQGIGTYLRVLRGLEL